MGVLWVRWFGHDLDAPGGFQTRHLHRVGFVDFEDPNAFGFLDPNVVIRVVHLIPAFACGRTSDLLLPSLARKANEDDEDWRYYYVNMYVHKNSESR